MKCHTELDGGLVMSDSSATERPSHGPGGTAGAELIAAVDAIYHAVRCNAAPINVMAALRELSLDDAHITLHPELLLDLFQASGKE